jgi:hypothetical protein
MAAVCSGWQVFVRRDRGLAAVAVVALAATGCKTGTAGIKPSWWSFGGTTADASKLAAAPTFTGSVEKPSASAKPYPTTTTPQGYVLTDTSRAPGQVAQAPAQAESVPATVTYGVTPPPATASVAATPASPAYPDTGKQPSPLSSIAPQVGPYAGLPAEPASASPAATAAPLAAAGFGAADAASPPAQPAIQRVADARGAEGWPAPPSPAAPAATGDSRYQAATGSRFGGDSIPASPAFNAASTPPAPLEPLPAAAAPAAVPAASDFPAAPAAYPAGSSSLPAAASPSPSAPPARRPDPGYRPGGTSSYRPSKAILAGDEADVPAVVQPVGFESPLPAGR